MNSMRTLLIICFIQITGLSFQAFAQKTKFVKEKLNDSREEYYVLKGKKGVRHGSYRKYVKSNVSNSERLRIEGDYKNNLRVGDWKFYSEDGLEQVYNFSTTQLVSVSKLKYPNVVEINGERQEIVLDSPPIYLGSNEILTENLNSVMEYPKDALLVG